MAIPETAYPHTLVTWSSPTRIWKQLIQLNSFRIAFSAHSVFLAIQIPIRAKAKYSYFRRMDRMENRMSLSYPFMIPVIMEIRLAPVSAARNAIPHLTYRFRYVTASRTEMNSMIRIIRSSVRIPAVLYVRLTSIRLIFGINRQVNASGTRSGTRFLCLYRSVKYRAQYTASRIPLGISIEIIPCVLPRKSSSGSPHRFPANSLFHQTGRMPPVTFPSPQRPP